VHIDRNARSPVFEVVRESLGSRDDVILLPRYRTPWGSFGLVRATLEGLRSAREASAETVVLLSGQDYPIRSTRDIEAFFADNPGRSFIEMNPLPRADWPGLGGLERYIGRGFSVLGRDLLWRDRRRTAWMPLRNVSVGSWTRFHGSMQFALHAAACDLVLERFFRGPALRRAFSAVQIPDETAIHTVLGNSPFLGDLDSRPLVYADWSRNGPHPETLTVRDLPDLMATSDALFARKFDEEVDPELLDLVDARLRTRTS
jgi:hypothetical protein